MVKISLLFSVHQRNVFVILKFDIWKDFTYKQNIAHFVKNISQREGTSD